MPDLFVSSDTGWLPVGDDFLPPPSGPGPVTFDKRHPYVDNPTARRTGTRPTYRVADLSNPILQPWAVEEMRKANEEVLAGKVPFRARESCYPGGVPGFLIYNLVFPNRFFANRRAGDDHQSGRPRIASRLFERAAFRPGDTGVGTANRSATTRAKIRWWSTRSASRPRASSTITARPTPRRCMWWSASN